MTVETIRAFVLSKLRAAWNWVYVPSSNVLNECMPGIVVGHERCLELSVASEVCPEATGEYP